MKFRTRLFISFIPIIIGIIALYYAVGLLVFKGIRDEKLVLISCGIVLGGVLFSVITLPWVTKGDL
jgi:NhaP-type Na+/H+ or K+/H+ antiporter